MYMYMQGITYQLIDHVSFTGFYCLLKLQFSLELQIVFSAL